MSNEILIESYFKAIHLELEQEFVDLLLEEITRRKLNLDYYLDGAQVS